MLRLSFTLIPKRSLIYLEKSGGMVAEFVTYSGLSSCNLDIKSGDGPNMQYDSPNGALRSESLKRTMTAKTTSLALIGGNVGTVLEGP